MLDSAQLKTIGQRLALRAAQLEQDIAAARRRTDEPALSDVADAKDAAESAARAVVVDAEAARDLAELRDIAAARQRIDEGRYGTCLDCGEEIDPHRLLAQPHTLRCVACQAAVEHGRTRATPGG
ncbi:MAG TPA: TraR/DksA C4-type zinc finger protein [Caldimonas sp.]|nr:TraR/DksA C4-type zinc finger protein [Caldimonas sp.]